MKKSIIEDEEYKYNFDSIPRKRWKSSLERKTSKKHVPKQKTIPDVHVRELPEIPISCDDCGPSEQAATFTSIPKDKLYAIQLQQHPSSWFTDRKLNVIIMPDFNHTTNLLTFHKYCVIQRKAVCIQREWKSIYACTCDIHNMKVYDAVEMHVTDNTGHTSMECIHITVVKGIHREVSTADFKDVDLDHGYCQATDTKDKVVDISSVGNPTAAVFLDTIGVVGCRNGNLECFVCHTNCQHVRFLDSLSKSDEDIPDVVDSLITGLCDTEGFKSEYQFKCYSVEAITFKKNSPMSFKFNEFLSNTTETKTCSCGGETDFVSKKVVLFTLLRILEVTVVTRKCPLCGENYDEYDGREDDILNMGSFLIHHSVLRDYMYHFLYARCSIHSYFCVWRASQEAEGNDNFGKCMSYAKFRHSWYAFLHLLDCAYDDGFTCTICGESPSTILMDATGLSHRKMYAPPVKTLTEEEEVRPLKPLTLFIPEKSTRTMLLDYVDSRQDTTEAKFQEMKKVLDDTVPSLSKLMQFLEDVGHTAQPPKNLATLISQLASHSHITGYVNKKGTNVIQDVLSGHEKLTSMNFLHRMNDAYPVLFNVLKDEDEVPEYLVPVFKSMLKKSEKLGHITSTTTNLSLQEDNRCSWFPKKPIIRKLHKYEKKNIHMYECKVTANNKKLLPGIFTLLCPHGIYYGYHLLDKVESVEIPFNILWTRFSEGPSTIIYDNACNLHSYCMRREPDFFGNCQFLVDRMHVRGHKCASGYDIGQYTCHQAINSQVVEQANSALVKLKPFLSYMNNKNFMTHLRFFVWFSNQKLLKKMV